MFGGKPSRYVHALQETEKDTTESGSRAHVDLAGLCIQVSSLTSPLKLTTHPEHDDAAETHLLNTLLMSSARTKA